MKRIILPVVALVFLAAACNTSVQTSSTPELPEARPADFEIRFHESGAPDASSGNYIVTSMQSIYEVYDGPQKRSWAFMTDAAALDALYATVRENQVLSLKAEQEKGTNENRFGYKLEMRYNGQAFSVSDQGNTYIQKEEDYNRFMEVIAAVREFVGAGISNQMLPIEVQLVLDAKAPRPDSLSVDVEAANLIKLTADTQPGDTLQGQIKPLKGIYQIEARASVAGKQWTWVKAADLLENKKSFTVLKLGKAGFEEVK